MEEVEETRVIYESEDLLAVYKVKGLATVPLKSNPEGDSLLLRVAEKYPEVLSVRGANPWEGGIIHRLDTPTSGIVLCARNQETFDELLILQKNDKIIKHYRAEVGRRKDLLEGFVPFPYTWEGDTLLISSYFRTYGKKGASVRPVLRNSRHVTGKIYTTEIRRKKGSNIFECTITRGFRHQIRSHLSWCGYPIIGDSRYGGEEGEELLLEAYSISFPFRGKIIEISL